MAMGLATTIAGFAWRGEAMAQPATNPPEQILHSWYRLSLQLVRHTPTYSPPVAGRAFAYLGITAFEAVASGSSELQSLAGQLNGLQPVPRREPGEAYDEAMVVHAAMAFAVQKFFANTGPTGQRVVSKLTKKLAADMVNDLPADIATRSETHGQAIAAHVFGWSLSDGGADIENMGFPSGYALQSGPAHWAPTSSIAQQQMPLLPKWGNNRAFAMPNGAACSLPAPLPYSEETASGFYKQALEVYETKKNLTPEQRAIARFWSDDPMLSSTPPGHWLSIALQILDRDKIDLNKTADVLARLGIAMADAFIACWHAKYQYDLVRPITYIRRIIDPKWESLMTTPPFPEYPSGHSTQSAAAAAVLTQLFGENFGFKDATHARDGLPPRAFMSFWAAANEAGISRLYGGIHFRAAIENGLAQGRCVGAYANALRTWR
jgi:hypothetical protein